MNAELLMEARLRHPAGSRLRRGPAPLPVEVTGARPVLRLVPPMSDAPEAGVGPTHWPADTVDAGDLGDAGPWSGVQLTRRGRGVLFGLLLVGIFCGGLAFGSHASGADAGRHWLLRHTRWSCARARRCGTSLGRCSRGPTRGPRWIGSST